MGRASELLVRLSRQSEVGCVYFISLALDGAASSTAESGRLPSRPMSSLRSWWFTAFLMRFARNAMYSDDADIAHPDNLYNDDVWQVLVGGNYGPRVKYMWIFMSNVPSITLLWAYVVSPLICIPLFVFHLCCFIFDQDIIRPVVSQLSIHLLPYYPWINLNVLCCYLPVADTTVEY